MPAWHDVARTLFEAATVNASDPLHRWTSARIDEACRRAWLDYDASKTRDYTAYFKTHPELAHPTQVWSAKDIESALPPGWGELADLLHTGRHREHLSGKSSQVLALGLLGVSATLDPSHGWLWEMFAPLTPPGAPAPTAAFEVEVEPSLLGEYGKKRTSIDYLVQDTAMVVSIECKWREDGLGSCSCSRYGGNPATGACRDVIRDKRPSYWSTATDIFSLPERAAGLPCPLSPVYQAVRNVAAALNLSEPAGTAVFGLIYDANNPYFAGHGEWPGWPALLRDTLDDANQTRVRFRPVSWQTLMPHLVLDEPTRDWAHRKHGLA